jgi:hypothetical protein
MRKRIALVVAALMMASTIVAGPVAAQGGSDVGGAKKGPHFVACENTGNGAGGCPSNR